MPFRMSEYAFSSLRALFPIWERRGFSDCLPSKRTYFPSWRSPQRIINAVCRCSCVGLSGRERDMVFELNSNCSVSIEKQISVFTLAQIGFIVNGMDENKEFLSPITVSSVEEMHSFASDVASAFVKKAEAPVV